MEQVTQSVEAHGLRARAVTYRYRFCPRCRREWPARHQSCPDCVHWLGDQPLQRIEWVVAPATIVARVPERYELAGASALILRIVSDHPPSDKQLAETAGVIRDILAVPSAQCEVPARGWLICATQDMRRAFCLGCEIGEGLATSLPRLEGIFVHCASVRWGVWIDQYILPFALSNSPTVSEVAATAIFNFEPDNMILSSQAIYEINRRWEHFVGAPRRLLNGQKSWGYQMIGHKRPSSFDHAEAKEVSPFLGRGRELSEIDEHWRRVGPTLKLAVIAMAGSGKSRLIKEWLGKHPEIRALTANFSLFGGGVEDFASQLAELPIDRLGGRALVEGIVHRVHRENIRLLVFDDIHWAEAAGVEFLRTLLAALPATGMLLILAARPSGRQQLRALEPDSELRLRPLHQRSVEELARRLANSESIATAAARRSKGNPLFVEQFITWAAEVSFRGGESGPHSLHQIIAARIDHLSKVRIADIRQRLRWGMSWQRQAINDELGQLEAEVGLWLDRLETGDYADRVDAAQHLSRLERLDYEIFLTAALLGRPRPRSSRLREAIERLLIGSADQLLGELKRRMSKATFARRQENAREARHAADVLYDACKWELARQFYELAYSGALWDQNEISQRLTQCRRRSQNTITDDREVYSHGTAEHLDETPSVTALNLPHIWADLGQRHRSSRYFLLASEAAKAINDLALAAWAERKAAEIGKASEVFSET